MKYPLNLLILLIMICCGSNSTHADDFSYLGMHIDKPGADYPAAQVKALLVENGEFTCELASWRNTFKPREVSFGFIPDGQSKLFSRVVFVYGIAVIIHQDVPPDIADYTARRLAFYLENIQGESINGSQMLKLMLKQSRAFYVQYYTEEAGESCFDIEEYDEKQSCFFHPIVLIKDECRVSEKDQIICRLDEAFFRMTLVQEWNKNGDMSRISETRNMSLSHLEQSLYLSDLDGITLQNTMLVSLLNESQTMPCNRDYAPEDYRIICDLAADLMMIKTLSTVHSTPQKNALHLRALQKMGGFRRLADHF